jgi:alpha-L-rhamnosidase
VVFDMTNRTDVPSYGAQLAAGATSLTEAWDADPASSQNHCMLGHIEEWFYAGLAGIRPDPASPGLSRIRIRPEPVGDVKSVDAAWETYRGPVAVRWNLDAKTFRLHVEVPPGIKAEVFVPTSQGAEVSEGGVPWSKAAGVRRLRLEDGRTVFEVGSGSYDFAAE